MNQNYKIATVVGISIGIWTMVCLAMSPSGFDEGPVLGIIPNWDHRFNDDFILNSDTLPLEAKAIFLRFCWILVENGFFYLFICTALSLAFAKLCDLRATRPWLGVIVKSLKLAGLILAVLYVVSIPLLFYGPCPFLMKFVSAFVMLPQAILLLAIRSGLFFIVWLISLGIHSCIYVYSHRVPSVSSDD